MIQLLFPIHITGSIARGNPCLVKCPCSWIAVRHLYATLRIIGL